MRPRRRVINSNPKSEVEILMKRHRLAWSVWLGIAVLMAVPAGGQAPDLSGMDVVLRSVPDGPVANVLGTTVQAEDFIDLYKSEVARIEVQHPNMTLSDGMRVELGLRTLGTIVEREVLYKEAQERGLSISESELESEWGEELRRLQHALSEEDTEPLSDMELLQHIGATPESAVDALRKALLIEKVREEIASERGVSVSEEEAREFFEEHQHRFSAPDMLHIRQIFIEAPPAGQDSAAGQMEDARASAEEALSMIRAGQSFEAVARARSDSRDADRGGDLGPMPARDLPPFYVEEAANLDVGGTSGIIESAYGYHIIRLEDRDEGENPSFEDMKDRVTAFLRVRKEDEAVQEFVSERLEEGPEVRVYLELDRQLAARPDLVEELQMNLHGPQ